MSTTKQLLLNPIKECSLRPESTEEDADIVLKGKCPICEDNLYVQISFTHRHIKWEPGGFIKECLYAKKTIDGWMTYKRDWQYLWHDFFLYLGDFEFIHDQKPEWQHKLHILNQHNANVLGIHQWINESLHKFINNHEEFPVEAIDGSKGTVSINWNVGICNNEELTEILDSFYKVYYKEPSKCATFYLVKRWWRPSNDDWSYWIPAFREWFYLVNDIDLYDIKQISDSKHYDVYIDKDAHRKDGKIKSNNKDLTTGLTWLQAIDKFELRASMGRLFKKTGKRLWKIANESDKEQWRAKKKSEKLLLSYLTHDEIVEVKNCERLTVKSKKYLDTSYEIGVGHKNVIEVYHKGKNTEALCLQLSDAMPIGDEVLTKYLACKFDEVALRKRAVVIERGN